jgi:kynurenine formamidase
MMLSLSHKLSTSTPFFEGLAKPELEHLYDLSRGDTCNSFYFRASNHCGTHVDAPWHFNPTGRKIADYEANELLFHRPALLDVAAGRGRLIGPDELKGAGSLPRDADIVLLRTGFGAYRADEKTYIEDSPGFSRASAEHMLHCFPHLRALAMDFPSLAAWKHMDEGAEAHRVFLGCEGYSDRTVLLIEDARLPGDLRTPSRVILAPWMIEGLDSAPCTLLAEYRD